MPAAFSDPFTDPVILGVIALVVGLAVLTFLEMKYVRKAIRGERLRKTRRMQDLPDDGHNAILTAKAVSEALRRVGVVTDEADSLISEADRAMARRNYRVVLELTDRAKGILKAEKARHDKMGDLARLEKVATHGDDSPTTKEQLTRDHPPNYMPSKFSIGLAEEAVAAGRSAGDVAPAERLVQQSKDKFEAGDYAAALALAVQARKVAEGAAVPAAEAAQVVPPAAPAVTLVCKQCGAPVAADDAFCRKCGAKLAA